MSWAVCLYSIPLVSIARAGPDAAAHTVSLIQSMQIHVSELEDGCMKQLKAYTGTAQVCVVWTVGLILTATEAQSCRTSRK